MTSLEDLVDVPAGVLTERLYRLSSDERANVVEQILHLAEMVRRRDLHLELGFPSLFVFCQTYLGYANATAYRRTKAAELVLRFPRIIAWLEDGRLTVTNLVELRDVLCEEKLDEILRVTAGRTEDEVKLLVAKWRPSEAPKDLFQRLPAPPASSSAGSPTPTTSSAGSTAPPPRPVRPATIEPISEEQRVLRVTVGKEFADDFAKVKAALSHVVPGGAMAELLHECIKITLKVCEKRRRGTGRAQRQASVAEGRYIPAPMRDEVWRRDDGCCAYVSPEGRRCRSTHMVEVHHLRARALGGETKPENLSLRCAAHNLFHARQDFGSPLHS